MVNIPCYSASLSISLSPALPYIYVLYIQSIRIYLYLWMCALCFVMFVTAQEVKNKPARKSELSALRAAPAGCSMCTCQITVLALCIAHWQRIGREHLTSFTLACVPFCHQNPTVVSLSMASRSCHIQKAPLAILSSPSTVQVTLHQFVGPSCALGIKKNLFLCSFKGREMN